LLRQDGQPSRSTVLGISVRAPLDVAFSLLEMIVVLVVLALVAGLSAPMVARSVGLGAERRAVGALATALTLARLDAIKDGRWVAVDLSEAGGVARVVWSDGPSSDGAEDHAVEPFPLVFEGGSGGPSTTARVTFGPRGRADRERIGLRSRRSADRLWVIEFDPVGGVPTARRHTEGSHP